MGQGSRKAQGTCQDPWQGLEAEEHQDPRESVETKGMLQQRAPQKKTAGKAPLSHETEKLQEGATEEQQESSVSSSTVPKEGEEGEQQPIYHKDSLQEKTGQITHTTRAPRTGGVHGSRSRSWIKTKHRERPPGNKGRDSRGPHQGAERRPPPDRGEDTT